MRILRHSKIVITMELYTMVLDEAPLAALKRLSDALGSAAVRGDRSSKYVELRGLEPLAFWMQTIFFAYFYVAQRRLTRLLPATIVAGCRWASPGVGLCWLFVWLF
jgi:hypothetical protein